MPTKKRARMSGMKAGPLDGLAEGQFVAYASVFGNRDSYGDVVLPGAFLGSLNAWALKGDPIPLYYNHDMGNPDMCIGQVDQAVEDEVGLRVTATIDLETPKGQQVYRLIKGRRVTEMSFAFNITEQSWEKDDNGIQYRALKALDLIEVSIVPLGANSETDILAVKTTSGQETKEPSFQGSKEPSFQGSKEPSFQGSKAGRVISSANEKKLRSAAEALATAATTIDAVLSTLDGMDSGAASAPTAVGKASNTVTDPHDQTPTGESSPDPDESPALTLAAAEVELLLLKEHDDESEKGTPGAPG